MPGLVKYGMEFFLLFLFPILGWGFHQYLSQKNTLRILIITILLFIPVFTDYSYTINFSYVLLGNICLACLFAFLLEKFKTGTSKLITSILLSGLLFLLLGFSAFVKAFAGSTYAEKEWEIDQYKIKYMRSQGFSGRPLLTYELHQYGFIPLLIKPLETVRDEDTTGSCLVRFEAYSISFDKCSGKIIK